MPEFGPKFREEQIPLIESFIQHHLRESGRDGVVLGMSGGVDSALVAKICADALGPKKVLGLGMPDGTGGEDTADAEEWANRLGIVWRSVDIGPIAKAFESSLKHGARADRVSAGNLRARVRMVALYYIANTERRLVMGTGNKSELLTGYFTRWGDGGSDLMPIGDLYKTQVRAMAAHLGLPKKILDKKPTAGLWKGQTDEGELGIAYPDLDRVLLGIELQFDPPTIMEKAGVPRAVVDKVIRMVAASVYKRKMPLAPKVGIRTVGLDWRE